MNPFWILVKVERQVNGEVATIETLENVFYKSCSDAERAGEKLATKTNSEIAAMVSFSICRYKFENILE